MALPQLAGLYALSLQGLMHINSIYPDAPRRLPRRTIHPGWGDPDEDKWWMRGWMRSGDRASNPNRLLAPEETDLPAIQGFEYGQELRTTPYDPTKPPIVYGYFPFTDLGTLWFQDGKVSGWLSANFAGYTTDSGVPFEKTFGNFRYDFGEGTVRDQLVPGRHKPITREPSKSPIVQRPCGYISLYLPDFTPKDSNLPNHFWDYFFVMVSDDEAQVIAADSLPRPCTGSGVLRKIAGIEKAPPPSFIEWPPKAPPQPNYDK